MRKMFACLIIVAGLSLIAFPFVREWHYDLKQRQLLDNMDHDGFAAAADNSERQLAASYEQLSELLTRGDAEDIEPIPASAVAKDEVQEKDVPQGIGVIEIDSIDVKLPILEGATTANMNYAAVHLTGTASLGEVGNAAIAAHRAHTKGRLFNRLGEVKKGDKITVRVKDKTLDYTVYSIFTVKPTDISVLKGNKTDSMITLITCDPLINPTRRLIVQAKL